MTPAGAIALTGLRSFTSRGLIERLLSREPIPTIVGLDLDPPDDLDARVRFCSVDLTEPTADARLTEILQKERCGVLIHAAFPADPDPDLDRAHERDVLGSLHVMGAVAAAGLRKLIVTSTAQVYGARPDNPNLMAEDQPLRPPAGAHALRDRAEVEALLRLFASRHPDVTVTSLRPCWIAGPTVDSAALRHLSQARVTRPLGFDPLMQFLHEEDWLSALELVLRRDARGAFNLAGRGALPLSTLLRLAGRRSLALPDAWIRGLSRLRWLRRTGDPPEAFYDYLKHLWVVDTKRARVELGFSAVYSTQEAWLSRFVGQRLREYA